MPPKSQREDHEPAAKKPRLSATLTVNKDSLQSSWLRNATSGQLLSHLVESSRSLEAPSIKRADISKGFIDELLKREYVVNPSVDCQVVLACILADVLKICAPEFVIPNNKCVEVLTLFCTVLGRIKNCDDNYTEYSRHLMESLALSHTMIALLQKQTSGASSSAVDSEIGSLCETFLSHTSTEDDAMLSNMAVMIGDTIAAMQSLTDTQLQLLMETITHGARAQTPSGYRVAATVLRRHEDLMQPVVVSHVVHEVDIGIEELKAVELADGEPSERRAALQKIQHAAEALGDLSSVSMNLCLQLFPAMSPYMDNEVADVRILVIKAFADAFVAQPDLCREYRNVYYSLLSRFNDPRSKVREMMLIFAKKIILRDVESDAFWAELIMPLGNKLLDTDEAVRRVAVEVVCDLAAMASARVPNKLLQQLGQRTLDKRPTVRQLAVDRLAHLYHTLYSDGSPASNRFNWIPSVILRTTQAENANPSAVEFALHQMLQRAPAGTTLTPGKKGKGLKTSAVVSTAVPVFDFELENEAAQQATLQSPAMALIELCTHLNSEDFGFLVTIMGKKNNLRKTVGKLFELRNDIRKVQPTSEEGRVIINNIHRLLSFLQTVTHATKDEWDALFKVKDEKVPKAFLSLASSSLMDYAHAYADVISKCKPVLKKEVTSFVESNLILRLLLPFRLHDVKELFDFATKCRGQKAVGAENEKYLGAVRAIHAIGSMAPHFLRSYCGILVDWIKADFAESDEDVMSVYGQAANINLKSLGLLDTGDDESDASPIGGTNSKEMITTIGRICLTSTNEAAAKAAAGCLVSLFGKHTGAFSQLLEVLQKNIHGAAQQTAAAMKAYVVAWLRTVQVFSKRMPREVAKIGDDLFHDIAIILATAVKESTSADAVEARSRKVLSSTGGFLKCRCPLADVVEMAAKALVTYAAYQSDASRIQAKSAEAFDLLIQAFKQTHFLDADSLGACRKRLALDKQMLKLMLQKNHDITKELALSIFLSAENNTNVRFEVQKKIKNHVTKGRGDMRFASLLFMTAIGEDGRQSWNQLRAQVQLVGDKLRQVQASGNVALNQPKALNCYLEYTVPFLILYTAHHAFYNEEEENHFVAFQRVWHLLFEELFRLSTSCANFVMELIRKIKQHDDALSPDVQSTRVMADLAAKVMMNILSQKSVGIDSLKQFPGSVLLPIHFIKPRDAEAFPTEKIYLDSKVQITLQAQFKLVVPGGARSHSADIQPAGPTLEESDDEGEAGAQPQFNFNPYDSPQPKATPSREAELRTPNTEKRPVAPPKQKGRSESNRAAATATTDNAPDQKLKRGIATAVKKVTGGLTADEIVQLQWKNVKDTIRESIGVNVDGEVKKMVHEELRKAYLAVAEE